LNARFKKQRPKRIKKVQSPAFTLQREALITEKMLEKALATNSTESLEPVYAFGEAISILCQHSHWTTITVTNDEFDFPKGK
jgi:hypothetical protein